MKRKWIKMYLDIASRVAQESHATRLKVGAVFVSKEGVLSIGINGLPPDSESNICEDETGKTKPEVSHAEENVATKLLRQGVSTKDGYMFQTHSPCISCIKLLANAGIKEIWYLHDHRDINISINYANNFNIKITQYQEDSK